MHHRLIPALLLISCICIQGNAQTKNILIEWYASAKVLHSVRAMVVLDDLKTKYNIIEVGMHGGGTYRDDMYNQDAENLLGKFGFYGIPMGMIDRTEVNSSDGLVPGVPAWENYVKAQAAQTPLVELDVVNTYNSSTRKLDISVDVDFLQTVSKASYVTVYLLEDSVIGSGSGYDQRNAFNNASGTPYYMKGDPIKGFPHRHVFRSNVTGLSGYSLGSNISKGSTKNYSTSLTLPLAYDADQVSVVAFVSYLSSTAVGNEVLNAAEESIISSCKSGFSYSTNGKKVSFTNESKGYGNLKWDFGDGNTSTKENPEHTYSAGGDYKVSLSLYFGSSLCAETEETLSIPYECDAEFSTDVDLLKVSFTDMSTGEVDHVKWDFGDGHSSTDANPVYTYGSEGVYSVELITYDANNDECSSQKKNVTVSTIDCAPDFIYDNSSLYVKFISTSGKEAKLFSWKLGDGTTTTTENPSHAYTEIREYNVCLETFDADNNSCGEKCKKVKSTSALDVHAPDINSKVVVYPNPSSGLFRISLVEGKSINNFKAYTTLGTLVAEGDLSLTEGTVDLTNQPVGVYFLYLARDKAHVVRLVKL